MYLPDYYEFISPVRIAAGHDALEKIPGFLASLNAKRPLILADKGVTAAGLIAIVEKTLSAHVAIGAIDDDIPPDSDLKVVSRLASVYRKNNCDAIIAVGGGSVLDTAKGLNILVSENSDNLMEFAGANKLKRKLRPFIAIPTTAGTGSELTMAAVIADHDRFVKIIFASRFLLPDVAIIDSRMTLTLPPFLTALTAMDAMTHAIESYTCLQKNPMSDAHALEAISLISTTLPRVIQKPDDAEGRLLLAKAATLAGMAFSNSTVGLVHTLGHSVGGVCGVPHGTCMAIFLPYGLEYNFHKVEPYIAELLFPLAGAEVYANTPLSQRAEKAIQCVRDLNQHLHDLTGGRHARFLSEILNRNGEKMVEKSHFDAIAKISIGDGTKFYNPEEIDYDDSMLILEAAWEGNPLNRNLVKKSV
jgi:alcohol dehydrogenase